MNDRDKNMSAEAKAVGLAYDDASGLPRVILKGGGTSAEAIVEEAKTRADVPVVKNADLAQRLYRLPIDTEIGRDLFEVVATVLAHVFALENKKARMND